MEGPAAEGGLCDILDCEFGFCFFFCHCCLLLSCHLLKGGEWMNRLVIYACCFVLYSKQALRQSFQSIIWLLLTAKMVY